MKVLVTGATGFVGPHLLAHLQACGDDVIDAGDFEHGFDVIDRAAVEHTISTARPEVVYHLAARSNVADSWRDPISTFRTNVEGTVNVLDAARTTGVRRVLVIGSAEEYGRTSKPVSEEAPLRPLTPYGASKAAASLIALQASLASGPDTVRVRPFSHTGPGQSEHFLVPALARRIAQAEEQAGDAVAIGNTEPVRDICDVRDIVRAYRLLVEYGASGDVYNVCSGEGISVGALAARLTARSQRPLRVEVDQELVRPVEVPYLVGDPGKLQRLTRWRREFSLDDTLDAVLAEARAGARQGS
jgi:GDP-4-dehydro-6-deoxy-D-mannose reductase